MNNLHRFMRDATIAIWLVCAVAMPELILQGNAMVNIEPPAPASMELPAPANVEPELKIAVMYFTKEEAEALLQRFEDERAEAERARQRTLTKSTSNWTALPYSASVSEEHMLAVIIGQETAGVNEEIMMQVGQVILNRVDDPRFPSTIYAVLTDKGQYGHDNGEGFYFPYYVDSEGRDRSYRVARRLLSGERVIPSNVVWQAGFMQGDGLYKYHDIPPHGIYLCY